MPQARHYVIPFLVFIILTQLASWFPQKAHFLYALKTFLVAGLLYHWRHLYQELFLPAKGKDLIWGVISGFLVFFLWVGGEEFLPQLGEAKGFSPYSFGLDSIGAFLLASVRLFGASLVVPIMEELFWRSFLMRYLIDRKFWCIPLGTYQPFAFWAVAILFSLEHFRVIPGFLAGITYGALVCLSKNIMVPILSHAVTNLSLGVYVLWTQKWAFW